MVVNFRSQWNVLASEFKSFLQNCDNSCKIHDCILSLSNLEVSSEAKFISLYSSITGTFLQDPPFVFKSSTLPERKDSGFNYYYDATSGLYFYGYCIDLMFALNSSLNFDFVLMESTDGSYGAATENGSWTGMVNDLLQNVSELLLCKHL